LEKNTAVIFDDKRFLEKCWTHDIETLVKAAGLQTARDADARLNSQLGKNWLLVKDWNEVARYKKNAESDARLLYKAITDHTDGVLPWIKIRW
jgi:hypothetical protein